MKRSIFFKENKQLIDLKNGFPHRKSAILIIAHSKFCLAKAKLFKSPPVSMQKLQIYIYIFK